MKKNLKRLVAFIALVLIVGFVIPQNLIMPVVGATKKDYNAKTFWYYPWGKSVTHKGVDIFAKTGTSIISATKGLVVSVGENKVAGKYIIVLGPKWRFHYYAHLNSINTKIYSFVTPNNTIATVGDSGNAKGKAPHLHYAIITAIPYFWEIDKSKQGWKKMFYLNPIKYLSPSK